MSVFPVGFSLGGRLFRRAIIGPRQIDQLALEDEADTFSRRTFQAGDKIDLTYYPLRDERPGGFNVTVTFRNGKTIAQLPQQN